MMRAAINNRNNGIPVYTDSHPRPDKPQCGFVTVKTQFAVFDHYDFLALSDSIDSFFPIQKEPFVLGWSFAGRIIDISANSSFSVGMFVVGFLPFQHCGGCAEYVNAPECLLFPIDLSGKSISSSSSSMSTDSSITLSSPSPSSSLSNNDKENNKEDKETDSELSAKVEYAVCFLSSAVLCFNALFHKYNVSANSGNTLLIVGAGSQYGIVMLRLACSVGLRVIAAVASSEELIVVNECKHGLKNVTVVDISSNTVSTLKHIVLQETNGIGVNYIFDVSSLCPNYFRSTALSFVDFAEMISPHGNIASANGNVTITPPLLSTIMVKNATISPLCALTWASCPTQCGKLSHIVERYFELIANGTLQPFKIQKFTITEIGEAYRVLSQNTLNRSVLITF